MTIHYLIGRDPDGNPTTLDVADVDDFPSVGFGYDQPIPPSDYPPPIGSNFVRYVAEFDPGVASPVLQADVTGAYILSAPGNVGTTYFSELDFSYRMTTFVTFFLPESITGKFKVYAKGSSPLETALENLGGGAGYASIQPLDEGQIVVMAQIQFFSKVQDNPVEVTFHLVPEGSEPEPTDFWTNLVLAREVV